MDYETYCKNFFVDPQPFPKFEFMGLHGATLFFSDYEAALDYYSTVLGPPAYIEREFTRGWRIGNTWLTLLKGNSGNPVNIELTIIMQTPQEAERLQAAFIEAGGTGEAPSDQLMYEPVRFCPIVDPFGTNILMICPLR